MLLLRPVHSTLLGRRLVVVVSPPKSNTLRRCLGSYSRMMDMGGAPSAMTDNKTKSLIKNASKHCNVKAVCFDFDALTKSTQQQAVAEENNDASSSNARRATKETEESSKLGQVQPITTRVKQMAAILNVSLGGSKHDAPKDVDNNVDDDLSLLLTGNTATAAAAKKTHAADLPKAPDWNKNDVRAKYAAKLKQKGTGVAGIERAKAQVEEGLSGGDAAGHWAARKVMASSATASSSNTKNHHSSSASSNTHWMAGTGTGTLLQYLTQRSMKIVLLPRPTTTTTTGSQQEEKELLLQQQQQQQSKSMHDLQRQLMDVVFTLLPETKQTTSTTTNDVKSILQTTLTELQQDVDGEPIHVLLVSDRDDYIRAAKEVGMVTCRIRPPNARRGNVSAHYMVATVPEVKDIIDQINGISYNAVLKSQS